MMMLDHGIAWMISGPRQADVERELVVSAQKRELRAIVARSAPGHRPSLTTRLARLVGLSGRPTAVDTTCCAA